MRSLGDYLLDDPIASGGMATVYLARHRLDRRTLAVKVLAPHSMDGRLALPAFRGEVRAAASLHHAHVVGVFDHGVVEPHDADEELPAGVPWLAMEYMSGGDLRPHCGAVSWSRVRGLLFALLDGLAHAHARGVLHRDLKPGNVLLGADGRRAKLADFGLAHALDGGRGGQDDVSVVLGTPAYMAPEQLQSAHRDFGPWTDLYALGCLTYAMVTGEPPYGRGDLERQVRGHIDGAPEPLEGRFGVPSGFDAWVGRLLAKRPGERFRRAAHAAAALARLEDPRVSAAVLPVGALEDPEDSEEITQPVAAQPPQHTPEAFGDSQPERPAVPEQWRAQGAEARRTVHGSGLSLYGLRTIGVVGRTAEQDRLWAQLREAVEAGRPRVVLLEGPSGIGVSRLLRWLHNRAHELGVAEVVEVRSGEGPGIGIARHLNCLGLQPQELLAQLRRRLPQFAPVEHRRLAELIAPGADLGEPVQFTRSGERHAVACGYLRSLADTPVVLVIDDAHRDPDLLALAAAAAELAQPLLVVLGLHAEALADDAVSEAVEDLQQGGAELLGLGPLEPEATSALVRDLLGLDPILASQLEDRCGGNPGFAERLVSHLVARGALVPGPRGYALGPGGKLDLPDSVAEEGAAWLARLEAACSEPAVLGLEVAAVLGNRVEREAWQQATSMLGAEADEEALEELAAWRLVWPHEDGGGFSFASEPLRLALVDRAERGKRLKPMHLACAMLLEPRGDAASVLERARHLLEAGRRNEAGAALIAAVRSLLRRGEQGRSRSLLSQHGRLLRRLGVGADHPRRIEHDILRAQWLRAAGRPRDAMPVAEDALRRARDSGDRTLTLRASIVVANTLGTAGDHTTGRPVAEAAVTSAHELGDPELQLLALTSLAWSCLSTGDYRASLAAARDGIGFAAGLGDPSRVGQLHNLVAQAYLGLGRVDEAEVELGHAMARFEEAGNRWGTAVALNHQGELARRRGQLEEASLAFAEAAGRFHSLGAGDHVFPRRNLGQVLVQQGRWAEAIELLRDLEDEADRRGLRVALLCASYLMLAPLAELRRFESAERRLDRIEQLQPDLGFAEPDLAQLAERGARSLRGRGQQALARRAWQAAANQWQALGRDVELRSVLDELV